MVKYRGTEHYLLKFDVSQKGLLSMHGAFRNTFLHTHLGVHTHSSELYSIASVLLCFPVGKLGVNTSLKVSADKKGHLNFLEDPIAQLSSVFYFKNSSLDNIKNCQ